MVPCARYPCNGPLCDGAPEGRRDELARQGKSDAHAGTRFDIVGMALRKQLEDFPELLRRNAHTGIVNTHDALAAFCRNRQRNVRAIRDDLAEAEQRAVRCANRSNSTEAPEARAVFAHVPALIGRASHAVGGLQFQARNTGVAVLLREIGRAHV